MANRYVVGPDSSRHFIGNVSTDFMLTGTFWLGNHVKWIALRRNSTLDICISIKLDDRLVKTFLYDIKIGETHAYPDGLDFVCYKAGYEVDHDVEAEALIPITNYLIKEI